MSVWDDPSKPPLVVTDEEAKDIVKLARRRTGGATHLVEVLLRARGPDPGHATREEVNDPDFGWTFQSATSTGLLKTWYVGGSDDVRMCLTDKGRAQLRLHVEAVRRHLVAANQPIEIERQTATRRSIDVG